MAYKTSTFVLWIYGLPEMYADVIPQMEAKLRTMCLSLIHKCGWMSRIIDARYDTYFKAVIHAVTVTACRADGIVQLSVLHECPERWVDRMIKAMALEVSAMFRGRACILHQGAYINPHAYPVVASIDAGIEPQKAIAV